MNTGVMPHVKIVILDIEGTTKLGIVEENYFQQTFSSMEQKILQYTPSTYDIKSAIDLIDQLYMIVGKMETEDITIENCFRTYFPQISMDELDELIDGYYKLIAKIKLRG